MVHREISQPSSGAVGRHSNIIGFGFQPMSPLQTVTDTFATFGARPALHWQGKEIGYAAFHTLIEVWQGRFPALGIRPGTVCAFTGNYSPQTCALQYAMMKTAAIMVPLAPHMAKEMDKFL